ncbi:glycosyltransferase [Yinghuangia sp. ASG 101]|uniref:glycosyltransferase n=1 Tax=Yinghuangia sp. ASG 101 TaxID=2896848 RepID=UPI001E4B0EFE|nr:glycosyltransferase [Yinghuangia sp. ASG 101]UGQ10570.1 glycosyltransferase [Yinghuangia sp. ASG 101]
MSPPRTRVLWLTKGLGRGGAEQLLVNGARHVDRTRFDVEVAYVLPWKDALVPDLREAGVTVHCLGDRPPPSDRTVRGRRADGGAPDRADRAWPLRLRRLVTARGYDLVHTHMPVPAVAARVLARGTVLVHTEHNLWHRYRAPTRLANSWTYHRNSAVIAVSRAVAGTIDPARLPRGRAGVAPLRVIYHGPDLGGVLPGAGARERARRLLDLDPDGFAYGVVANFTPKKDHAGLLEAHALLRRTEPGARIVLVGLGPLEAALRERASRPDLAGSVVFTGSRGDVPELLPGFDVFALGSRQEGLPVALMEAMATGLPVVVTDVGGMPEIVTDGVEGRVVRSGDPAAFAAALAEAAADPALRGAWGQAARLRSRTFDVAGAQARIEDVYREVLAL